MNTIERNNVDLSYRPRYYFVRGIPVTVYTESEAEGMDAPEFIPGWEGWGVLSKPQTKYFQLPAYGKTTT